MENVPEMHDAAPTRRLAAEQGLALRKAPVVEADFSPHRWPAANSAFDHDPQNNRSAEFPAVLRTQTFPQMIEVSLLIPGGLSQLLSKHFRTAQRMLLKAIVAAGIRSPQVSRDRRAILLPRSEEQALAPALKRLEPRLRRQIFQPLSQKSAASALGLTPAKFRQMKRDGQITSSSKASVTGMASVTNTQPIPFATC
ncbi:MAG: hypothetical protein VX874_07265 [Pseudomonadota bacterium]|nr:hypothetical protein [Pseudomonadota bacterium]